MATSKRQQEAIDSTIEKLREILKGIDQIEMETEEGWWPTSTGAEFGAEKLAEVEELIEMSMQ